MKKMFLILLTAIVLLFPTVSRAEEPYVNPRQVEAKKAFDAHFDGEQYITRIEAAISLLEALVDFTETDFTTWDSCYFENNNGGYTLNIIENVIYPNVFMLSKSITKPTFTDISSLNRHELIGIAILQNLFVVSGFGDNTFRPNEYLTYGQSGVLFACAHHGGQEYVNNYKYPESYMEHLDNTWIITSIRALETNPNCLIPKKDFYYALYYNFIFGVDSMTSNKFPFKMPWSVSLQELIKDIFDSR
jgi:hypothetical protein